MSVMASTVRNRGERASPGGPAEGERRRPRISRGGWIFLLAMLGSAVIWAIFIAIIITIVHHHSLAQGS